MFPNPLPRRAGVHAAWLAAAVALAACAGASQKWTKAGIGAEARATDLEECQLFGQAAGLSAVNQADNTYVGISSTGQLTTTQLPGASALGYAAQGDAFARCMESRGYRRTTSQ